MNKKKEKIRDPRLNFSGKVILASAIIAIAFVILAPRVWNKIEKFDTPRDYRIPYFLSKDYGLYQRRMQKLNPQQIPLLGDSVIWGEYVQKDGTLSHFLNKEAGSNDIFVNGGVNGLFPLALEGLIQYYGKSLKNRKIILHFNPLWMTSPEADLSATKICKFNHTSLVPQFTIKIPCYKATFDDRASIVITRQNRFFAWVEHLQQTYFEQKNLYEWTLANDGKFPPNYPNATKNPLIQITFKVPEEPKTDPDRGVNSPRHKPWSTTGKGTQQFDWVLSQNSIQWAAFKRLTKKLKKDGNDVLIIVGPFNRHIMCEENQNIFDEYIEQVQKWLKENKFTTIAPKTLASNLYGDSSHPLTDGYKELAYQIANNPIYKNWLNNNIINHNNPTKELE